MANIHILGAGAVGLSFAFHLSGKHQITLLTRKSNKQPFYYQENTLKEKIEAKVIEVSSLIPQTKIDTCMIFVKSYQLNDAFNTIQPFLSQHASLIISHNGITDLSTISKALTSTQSLFFISTSRGALKPTYNEVKQTGIGDTFFGACNDAAKNKVSDVFDSLISESILPSAIHHNINLLRWQKLMVNIAINPLTALEQIPNGQLLRPQYAIRVMNLLNEACLIANFLGIDITLKQALNSAYKVMRQTRLNNSSMAQDIKQGRQTEIGAICGYIVNEAEKLGVNVPHNKALLKAIKQIEIV